MLNVFITVDADVWPRHPDWRETDLADDLARDFFGATPEGEFGIPYQIGRLNAHGLKAAFFLERLFASAAGAAPLRRMISVIRAGGQEAQLHLHPEWLKWTPRPALPPYRGDNLKDYSEGEQTRIVTQAVHNFRAAGGN